MATKPDSLSSQLPNCKRCGKAMTPLFNFLDSTNGKQVRVFQCECGDRAVG